MAFCDIRLPKDAHLSSWAAPLTPLALAFAALAEHANTDAAPARIESMRIEEPSDPSESPT
ncbi:hypothetical protein [Roseobacter sinensis]|uniref:Uncharacterized protein n=1 Tax=Roseobacter sinensis TaxID=2931391 RepID=A0ABT3B958_9RHOB|nr:hypothetical protein [Roseobacter sp. WL0113]MCV3270101.1 hypothetical protein [Roseobacter sp. WL0113]